MYVLVHSRSPARAAHMLSHAKSVFVRLELQGGSIDRVRLYRTRPGTAWSAAAAPKGASNARRETAWRYGPKYWSHRTYPRRRTATSKFSIWRAIGASTRVSRVSDNDEDGPRRRFAPNRARARQLASSPLTTVSRYC